MGVALGAEGKDEMSNADKILMYHGRWCAIQALRRGFWRLAGIADPDGFVDSAQPLPYERDDLEDLLKEQPTESQLALWLGTYRATLREGLEEAEGDHPHLPLVEPSSPSRSVTQTKQGDTDEQRSEED